VAITTPIPYDLLLNSALPGLTATLDRFGLTAVCWDGTPLEQRIQTLDDAAALLRNDAARHAPLLQRTESALRDLVTGTHQKDPVLLRDLARTLRTLQAEGAGVAPHHPSLEQSRLMTVPIGTSGSSQILMRGPAHLLRPGEQGPDLMRLFGKTVIEAWGDDPQKAREAFCGRAYSQGGHAPMEIQTFAATREELAAKISILAQRGMEVRTAPIPADVKPKTMLSTEMLNGRPIMHWIVARRSTIPLEAWFKKFVDVRDKRTGIGRLDVLDRTNVSPDDPELGKALASLFGSPVSWGEVVNGFAIDVPGYVTRSVSMQSHQGAGVSLMTEIATKRGEIAARLSGWLLPPPTDGRPWIAWGEDLNENLYGTIAPENIVRHLSQGIGRRALARILVFLHRRGVNALDMQARGHGLAFMPYIGFDFPDENTRRRILDEFTSYVEENEASLSDKTRRDVHRVSHAWDIVDFQNDRGEPIGREFMHHYSLNRRGGIPLRFWLDASYSGWWRLFSRDLALQPDMVDLALTTNVDQELAERVMMERAKIVRNSLPNIDLTRPLAERRRESEMREIISFLSEKLAEAQSNADLDDLTQLLKRRAFLNHNQELEQSLSFHRKGDNPEGHWVLMIDIDHFKAINDTYGHSIGDAALRLVAQIIQSCVRDGDLVCRWGGEEFAVVLRHAGSNGVKLVAERIRQEVERLLFNVPGGKRHPLSVSIGAAPFQVAPVRRRTSGEFNPYEEPIQVKNSLALSLDDADAELYVAKQGGRNRVVYKDSGISFG
jgi:diguanylate cyclase (GGDEF)-like protein